MIKPSKLLLSDQVAAITLSWGGAGLFPHRYAAGKRQLEAAFGVCVTETRHALRDPDWIYRNPQARADDLMEAFSDPNIKAIFAMIGGDDSIRTLPYIDLDIIRKNPKIFMGYSDTTIAHFACYKAGLVSFYGPSMLAGFAESGGMFPYMADSVRRTLFSAEPIGEIQPNPDGWTVEFGDWGNPDKQNQPRKLHPTTGWRYLQGKGVHRGRLIGGCYEIVDWLRGTEWFPPLDDWQDAILFLETSEEMPTPTQVKYTLRILALEGILPRLSGILFARPGGEMPPEKFAEYDRVLLDVVAGEAGLTDLPIISGMDFGHTDPMFVLPYGIQAEIDCNAQRFSIVESAVI